MWEKKRGGCRCCRHNINHHWDPTPHHDDEERRTLNSSWRLKNNLLATSSVVLCHSVARGWANEEYDRCYDVMESSQNSTDRWIQSDFFAWAWFSPLFNWPVLTIFCPMTTATQQTTTQQSFVICHFHFVSFQEERSSSNGYYVVRYIVTTYIACLAGKRRCGVWQSSSSCVGFSLSPGARSRDNLR